MSINASRNSIDFKKSSTILHLLMSKTHKDINLFFDFLDMHDLNIIYLEKEDCDNILNYLMQVV